MPVKVIYKNRRSDKNRRKYYSTYYDAERRSGVDRRQLEGKLKHMLEKNVKDQNKKKQKSIQSSTSSVILRKKRWITLKSSALPGCFIRWTKMMIACASVGKSTTLRLKANLCFCLW
jgi:hypothetical protein